MDHDLPPVGRRITRLEAAQLTGVSKSKIRRLEGAAFTAYRNSRGTVVLDREEVEAWAARAVRQGGPVPAAALPTDTILVIYELLDHGAAGVDIVRKLRLHPDDVERVLEQAARLSTPWPADRTLPGDQRPRGSRGAPDHEVSGEIAREIVLVASAVGTDLRATPARGPAIESDRSSPMAHVENRIVAATGIDAAPDGVHDCEAERAMPGGSASDSASGASGSGQACPTGRAISAEPPPPQDPSTEVDHRDHTGASHGDASGAASGTIGSGPDQHVAAQAMADRHTQDLLDFLQILREAAALKA